MKTKNRVLWVNPSFLDYRIPLYSQLNHMLEDNFHLIYSSARIPERCDIKIKKELNENAHPLIGEIQKNTNITSDFANKGINIPRPKGLYKAIKQVKPDIIIAEGFFQFTPWALLYSVTHRIPLYIAYERTLHTERNCPAWRTTYRKFVNKFVKGYIANGKETKDYLEYIGVDKNKIFTGGMCADSVGLAKNASQLTPSDKEMFRQSLHLGEGGIVYLYVGQLIERKGVKHLLHAWNSHVKKFPNDQLLIVGDGNQLTEFKEKYNHEKSIIFTGGIDYSEIYKYYAVCDIFVIPTLEDNWSLVVPEAMACGLPIACSIYNGCHPDLVIPGHNGFVFDTLNQDSIVGCLAKFHENNLEEMGQNSIALELKFSPEKTAQNILNAISGTPL